MVDKRAKVIEEPQKVLKTSKFPSNSFDVFLRLLIFLGESLVL